MIHSSAILENRKAPALEEAGSCIDADPRSTAVSKSVKSRQDAAVVNASRPSDPSDRAITVVFAGGGSGGHIAPGLAIAERLKEISPESKPIFVCSQRPIDAAMLSEAHMRFVPIPATPPAIKPAQVLRFLMSFRDSRAIVK